MPAPVAIAAAPAPEREALTKTQKLAALLVMLGTESAAEILKQFQPREIESISREMAHFSLITRQQQEEILHEFSEVAVTASTSISAGVDITRGLLEKALGNFKAGDILDRVIPNSSRASGSGALQTIADMDSRSIFNLIRDEQPQTIAFIASHLAPEKAAQMLGLLRPDQRGQVVERLANLAPVPAEVAEKVANVLNARLGVKLDIKQTRVLSQTGGVTSAADILNAMDKNLSRTLLGGVEEKHPELFQAIRKRMFNFEDLRALNPQSIQRIMREIETRDLALALRKTSEPLKKLLLSNISRRAAEDVVDEMKSLGPVKVRDVEAAQLRIIHAAHKLETEGEIDLHEARNAEYEMV